MSFVPSAVAQAEPGANSTRDAGYAVQESTLDESSLSVAQDTSSSYNVQENERSDETLSNSTPNDNEANDGPVRLARFSLVSGNVTWRGDDDVTWSEGTVNLPLRQGAQIWVTEGGRAEIQFDDGSLLRLGNDALVTLQTLHSEANGEYTALQLHSGLISLRLRHEDSFIRSIRH
jgi:hypothetical protein